MAALAAPSLPLAALGLPLVVYLPEFYAGEMGLSLAAVGVAFMCVRLLDIGFDPFIGAVMDRTRTRFGRFRPWFVASTPILMLAAYMLFMPRQGVGAAYLWFWLLVIYAGFSIATLAQLAWGAVLSPDYDQRSRIYAWWQGGNVVGVILALILPVALVRAGVEAHAAGVGAMGWFIIVMLPSTLALAIAFAPEPRIASAPEKASLKAYFGLLKLASVRRLLAADFATGMGPAITGALFFFYFERVKGFSKHEAEVLLLIYFLGGLAGAAIWARLAYMIGKHRALAAASLFYAVVTAAVVFLPRGNVAAGGVMMFLIGLPFSAGGFLLRAMMADVGDEVRLKTGIDRTGLLYALLSGTVKLASAAAVGVTFVGLELAGFDAKAAGTDAGLAGLSGMFVAVPVLLALLAGAIILAYPLTAERHALIRAQLDARDLSLAAPEMAARPLMSEEIHAVSRPVD